MAPLGPPALTEPASADLNQPLFANDMVTPAVDPQPESLCGSHSDGSANRRERAAGRPNGKGWFHFSSCRFLARPALAVVLPTRPWRSHLNPGLCCCSPADWLVCSGSCASRGVNNRCKVSAFQAQFSQTHGALLYVQAGILLLLATWLYGPFALRMASQWWQDPNYTHGFFVPVFALFLLWERRAKLAALRISASLVRPRHSFVCPDDTGSRHDQIRIFSLIACRSCFLSPDLWSFLQDGNIWRRFRSRWHSCS